MTGDRPSRPVRAAVFAERRAAENALAKLQEAGFGRDRLSVICAEPAVRKHFPEFAQEEPAGADAPEKTGKGGVAGAILGGLAAAAGVTTTGGLGLVAAGSLFAVGAASGAVVGGFVGAMASRGTDKEAADFYDRALEAGKILVAVEVSDDTESERADEVLRGAGAEPLSLRDD